MSESRFPAASPAVAACDISVIVPIYNEAACIPTTLAELVGVLDQGNFDYEILAVDDGSTDQTPALLAELNPNFPRMRVFTVRPNSGQSAAFGVGFREARGRAVVLIDADGQNDPRDIPRLLAALDTCDAVCGNRVRRQDSLAKRLGGRLANRVRGWILADGITDTGCSLKAIRTAFVRDLPMHLSGMHRFIPSLLQMRGARISEVPVNHRPRRAGHSKYSNFGRLRVTIADLRAVRWMQKRNRHFDAKEES